MLEGWPAITSQTADSQDQSENNAVNIRAREKGPRKLRAACDGCHAAKTRCTGGTPCARCYRDNLGCHYSFKAKVGKPKGSMNKKTIERLRRMREAQDREIHEAQGAAPTPPATSNTSAAVSSSDARPDLLQIPSELGDFCIPIRLSEPAFEEFFLSDECLLELDNNWPLTTAESPCRTDNAQLPLNAIAPQVENNSTTQDAGPTIDTLSFVEEERHENSPQPCTTPSESSLAPVPLDPQALPVHQELKTQGITHPKLLKSRACDDSLCGITSCTHSPCACFSTAINHLCNLRTTPRSADQFRSIDTLLIHSRRILPSMRHLLKCHSCTADTQALFLAMMVLSRLLEWSRSSLSARGVCAEVRLGRYCASGEFGAIVATMMIQKHLGEIKQTVAEFKKSVDEIPQGNPDAAYLTMQAKGFESELDGLIGRLPNDSAVSAH